MKMTLAGLIAFSVACGGVNHAASPQSETSCANTTICAGAANIREVSMCGWPGTIYECAEGSANSFRFVFCDTACTPGAVAYWKTTDPIMCEIIAEDWAAQLKVACN